MSLPSRKLPMRALLMFVLMVCSASLYGQVSPADNSVQRNRMNEAIDSVRDRIDKAAEAANYVVRADEHRREAERLSSAGRRDEARVKLQQAAKFLGTKPGGNSSIQGDVLLQDYLSRLRADLTAMDDPKEQFPGRAISRWGQIDSAYPFIREILIANGLPPELAAAKAATGTTRGNHGSLRSFPHRCRKCRQAMEKIAREVSEHYTIGYYPTNRIHDGKWRKTKVEVKDSRGNAKYVGRTRTGYYAPGER